MFLSVFSICEVLLHWFVGPSDNNFDERNALIMKILRVSEIRKCRRGLARIVNALASENDQLGRAGSRA
jgi:hypothetical protein